MNSWREMTNWFLMWGWTEVDIVFGIQTTFFFNFPAVVHKWLMTIQIWVLACLRQLAWCQENDLKGFEFHKFYYLNSTWSDFYLLLLASIPFITRNWPFFILIAPIYSTSLPLLFEYFVHKSSYSGARY